MPPLLDGGGGGAVVDELVQTTLDHFREPMIAGKIHSEILLMNRDQRGYWYRKISPTEKAEAMQIVEMARRAKLSSATKKRWETPESRTKISEGLKRYWEDPKHRAKRSVMMSGEDHPAKRPESRVRMSKWAKKQWNDPEYRAKMSGENNPMNKPEVRAKISGENNPSWKGGISFLPYCHLFNDRLKESIRNRDNRTCVLCGKGEIQNGERLSVHHIDGSKMQGCNGVPWYLCALCRSCNSRPDTVEKEFLIVTGGHSG